MARHKYQPERNYQQDFNKIIDFISDYYFIDPDERTVAGTTVNHWNNRLLGISYGLNRNTLVLGEPGCGKTTFMKVFSSVLSSYPFDLYEAAQIQGHPDQTFNTMIARLDFAKLKERESVIWLLCAYLPVRNIDEVNRLPPGKQDELLDALQTGRFNYLNSTLYTGKTPFFATANHPDDGNHILINPLRDRFAIHVELGHIGATYRAQKKQAEKNIDSDLRDPKLTDCIINLINDPEYNVEQRLKAMEEERKDFVAKIAQETQVTPLTPVDQQKIREAITAIPLSSEAKIFAQMISAELNYTPTYGRKRSSDPVDTSNHAQGLASRAVKNAASDRVEDALEEYAQGLVYLLGGNEVSKDHLLAVGPHVLGHRLDFTDDFRAQHAEKDRIPGTIFGRPFEMHLATKLLQDVDDNYRGKDTMPGIKEDLDLLVTAWQEPGTLSATQRARAKDLLTTSLEHPLLREYVHRIKKEKPELIARLEG